MNIPKMGKQPRVTCTHWILGPLDKNDPNESKSEEGEGFACHADEFRNERGREA
jgi:hypothetical protein